MRFHLQTVFCFDAGEALKYYIMNTLKKLNRVSIRQFFVQVEQLNSYLKTLPCLYYSPNVNQATKEVLPLDDADLTTHLLRMCPARWQTQYNLTKNTTPVSTRALLLVLENIENNANLDNKSQNANKPKGAEGKCKRSHLTPKSQRNPRRWAGLTSTAYCARSMGGRSRATTRAIAITSTRMALQSRIMGTQVDPSLIRRDPRHKFCAIDVH